MNSGIYAAKARKTKLILSTIADFFSRHCNHPVSVNEVVAIPLNNDSFSFYTYQEGNILYIARYNKRYNDITVQETLW